jgi:hypothetical protein
MEINMIEIVQALAALNMLCQININPGSVPTPEATGPTKVFVFPLDEPSTQCRMLDEESDFPMTELSNRSLFVRL